MEAKQISDVQAIGPSLRVIEIDPQTDKRWEAFMASMPNSWMYYHPIWLQVIQEAYGFKPAHLACEESNGRLVGILPLFYQRGWRTGRTLRSSFTGPLVYNDQAIAALLQAAMERTHSKSNVQLHLKIMSNAFDGLVEGVVGVPVYETYVLALPERADLLRLEPTIKRAINKATRLGVEVRQAENEGELRAWYELYLQTMRKLNALPNPYRYYKLAWRQLHSRGMMRLLLAEHVEAGQRRLVGGIVIFLYGQTISFASAGWREEDQALRPNDLLHWSAIQDGCTSGFRWYDFGDVDLENHGLARYKSKWGAEAKLFYDYSAPVSRHATSSSDHEPSKNFTKQLLRSAWQHLPIKVVALLSDWYHALRLY